MADYDFSGTMSLFFGDDEQNKDKCTDCGTTDNLHLLYSSESGTSVWICSTCRARRAEVCKEQEAAELARFSAHEAFDEWEEGL